MRTTIERAKVLWPILEQVEFSFLEGKGETHFAYGLLDGEVRIVKVIQFIPSDASKEKRFFQLAQDLAEVLNKDFQTVCEALESN